MRFQIPINTLFTEVFGIADARIRSYDINANNRPDSPNIKFNLNVEEAEQDDEIIMSNIGTPVHFPMGIIGGNYNIFNNGVIESVARDGMWLPYTSVAGMQRSKRATETFMGGDVGDVIEQYGFESWDIRIQGFIIKDNDSKVQSVADQVKELQSYEELADAVQLRGKGFEIRKISRAWIKSITYPMARPLNINSVIPYEMNLKSVKPIQLILP